MNSISFSTQATQSSYHFESQSNLEESLNLSHINDESVLNPNPHKGVLTIDVKTSQVKYSFNFLLLLHLISLS